MAYQRPRIVVEESALGKFFQEMPNMLLSFMQLNQQIQFKAEEAEKDRQFRESQLYLKDLMDTKQLLQRGILDSNKTAEEKGLSFEVAFGKLDPKSVTAGGPKVAGDYMKVLKQDISTLKNEYSDILSQIDLANLGANSAMSIDTDFSGIIDTQELDAYQKASPELLEELGVPQLPEAFIRGAQKAITSPAARKQQKENKIVDARLNIIKGWDVDPLTEDYELDPQDARYEHQKAAIATYNIDPTDDKITTHIVDAITAEENVAPFKLYGQTWTSVGSGYATTKEGQAEIKAGTIVQHPDKYRGMWFRTEYPAGTSSEQKNILNQRKDTDKRYTGLQNNLRGIGKRTSESFSNSLAWDPNSEELPRADTFHELGPTHRENIAKNFATWFTQETQEGNDADNNAPSWMSNVFHQNGSWEDVERAVAAVMDDARFAPIVDDPAVLEKTFNWKGSKYKEDAANEFFMRSYDMFNLTEKALGRGADYSWLKDVSKVGEIDSTMQGDLDLLKNLIPGGNK